MDNQGSKFRGKVGSFFNGDSSHSQHHDDDRSRKDDYYRKDDYSRKGGYSRKDDYIRKDDYPRKDNRPIEDDYAKMERYRNERNDLRQSYKELEETTDEKILGLERALQTEQATVKVIKLSAHELQKTKDSKELIFGVQETDDVIRSRFESLLADIRTWASGFSCTTGQELHLEVQKHSEYRQVAPSCLTLDQLDEAVKSERPKQDKKQKRHFIRGWTSYVMIRSLFRILNKQGPSTGEDVGPSEVDLEAFRRLENKLWYTGKSSNFASQLQYCLSANLSS